MTGEILNPKSNAWAIAVHAQEFVYTAKKLIDGHKHTEDLDAEYGDYFATAAISVNASFAVELLLKAIAVDITGVHPRGHDLIKLFGTICDPYHRDIILIHETNCGYSFEDVVSSLTHDKNTFETFRYIFEESDAFSNFSFLIDFADTLLIFLESRHPEWKFAAPNDRHRRFRSRWDEERGAPILAHTLRNG